MPYGYGYRGVPTGQAGGGVPYADLAQLALSLVQGLSKPGAGEATAERARQMGAARGIDVETPNAPGILDKKKQAAMQTGETALNFVPVVGPALSAVASGARTSKTADAQQQYLKRIFAQNPDLFRQGETQYKSEFTPQTNFLANYAGSQPKFLQRGAEKMTHAIAGDAEGFSSGFKEGAKRGAIAGSVVPGIGNIAGIIGGGLMGGIGGKVLGSQAKQKRRAAELHAANVKKAKNAQEILRVNAQDAQARRLANREAQGSPQAQLDPAMAILMRILGHQQQGSPQAPPAWQGPLQQPQDNFVGPQLPPGMFPQRPMPLGGPR